MAINRAVEARKRAKAKREERIAKSKGYFSKEARAKRKAAKKPVDVVETKGGDYPVYKKESSKAESFRTKFAKASKAGKKIFKWKGKSYTTEKAPAKKAAPKAKPDVRKIVKNLAKAKAKPKAAPKKKPEKLAYSPLHPPKEVTVAPKPAPKRASEYSDRSTGPYSPREDQGPKFKGGGKVESGGGYGWPVTDARGRKK